MLDDGRRRRRLSAVASPTMPPPIMQKSYRIAVFAYAGMQCANLLFATSDGTEGLSWGERFGIGKAVNN
jgi:hypothetical protein